MTCLLLHAVFLKMKKTCAYVLIFFYFELYINRCCKEIYSFICYYKKEEEVNSKKILFNIFCRCSQTASQKMY